MVVDVGVIYFFFVKQKTAYELLRSLLGSEMCKRDSARVVWAGFAGVVSVGLSTCPRLDLARVGSVCLSTCPLLHLARVVSVCLSTCPLLHLARVVSVSFSSFPLLHLARVVSVCLST